MNIKHIVWDWNGTLLDDLWLSIKAINIVLKRHNLPQVNDKIYLNLFIFPVIEYYKKLGFDFEIIFLAQKKRYEIKEMPVNWIYCEGTKVTWQSHFKTLSELFEIKLNHLLGKYRI